MALNYRKSIGFLSFLILFIVGGCSILFPDADQGKVRLLNFFNPYIKRNIVINEIKKSKCFLVKNHSASNTDWKLCSSSTLRLVKCFKLIEDLQTKITRLKEMWHWDLYQPPFVVEVSYIRRESDYHQRKISIKKCRKKIVNGPLVPETI